MSKCPICGRENVEHPIGYLAQCGRRVTAADSPAILYPALHQRRQRMLLASKCREVTERLSVKIVGEFHALTCKRDRPPCL